jgi:hypothetical protein
MEGQMNIQELDKKLYPMLLCLVLSLLGLAGCETTKVVTFEPVSTEVVKKETPMNEVGVVEPNSSEDGLEPTPGPEFLVYTNQTYGFEFEYPGNWTLTEYDHGVVLIKDRNRIGIRFLRKGEDADRFSHLAGIPEGELIYSDKVRFMGQVIPVEMLVFEQKSKIVFFGETGRIEIDELVFSITLDDRETYSYGDVDLSEEIMAETKSIVESFNRIDKLEESTLGQNVTDTGLTAHLELPERLLVGEEINLKFTLTNESDNPLYFLKWYTPLEGIGGEIFKVTRDGQVVPYEGILASRAFPTSDSYVLINPGESVLAVVDLGTSFDFSEVGTYQIGFLSPRISHIARSEKEMAKTDDDLGPVQIPSNPVTLEIGDN